ncbi:MAG TPA: hypothetical protein VIF38_08035 [Burkholderiales bacterium]
MSSPANRSCAGRRTQRGAALILFATVLILGVAWFTVGALGKAAPTTADRETKTGLALSTAKKALLAYVAQKAADPTENYPGRLPCPESLGQPGTSADGVAAPVVSPSFPTCSSVGRLPWETLGVDQIRDGYGEPLWYAVTTGTWALVTSGTTLTINPGTANTITYNGTANAVVAVIIAPGPALNTLSAGTPPAGCSNVNQQTNRYAVPYVATKFLECGNATGSYTTAGTSPWSNDRTISITATEVMDAIAGAIADRMQRQVAPALNDWRTTTSVSSWGESFMPYASTFTAPLSNNMCGNSGVTEGMMPTIATTLSVSSGTCDTSWASGSASGFGLTFGGCTSTSTRLRCSFTALLGGLLTPTITATAHNVAYTFRKFDPSSQITVQINGGTQTAAVIQNFSGSVSGSGNGDGTISFQVKLPTLSIFDSIRIRITQPVDALLADSRTDWFLSNSWDRYTYYSVSQTVTANPSGICSAPVYTNCLTVNGIGSTNSNDKRIVLVYMGRQLSTQTWPSASVTNYMEGINAATGTGIYASSIVTSAFNDRVGACPFSYGTVTIC